MFVFATMLISRGNLEVNCSYMIGLQAIDLDPSDATLLSNRSLSWMRLGQADHALADAKACRALRPDWPKACYREGAALQLLQVCHISTLFNICLTGNTIFCERLMTLQMLWSGKEFFDHFKFVIMLFLLSF